MLSCLCTVLAGLLLLPLLVTLVCPYLLQDLAFFLRLVRILQWVCLASSCVPPCTLLEVFCWQARRTPAKALLLFHDKVYTYEQVDQHSSQVAQVLWEAAGVQEGDTVDLFLGNQPVYLCLGCTKSGCALACLNCNIHACSLVHCFQCSGDKVLLANPGEMPPCALAAPQGKDSVVPVGTYSC